jgi:glutaredoxin
MPQTVISFYTRKRCPLCEKAKKTILELKEEFNFSLEEIDIDESDELTELYGIMIPVVHIDGEEIAFGIVNKIDISNRLQEKNQNF